MQIQLFIPKSCPSSRVKVGQTMVTLFHDQIIIQYCAGRIIVDIHMNEISQHGH